MILLHQPAGRQADHAGIPPFSRQHQRSMAGEVEALQLVFRLGQNLLLHVLAATVFLLQFLGDGPRVGHRLAQQQLMGAHGRADAPTRIEPRRQLKSDIARAQLFFRQPCRLDQRANARPGRCVDPLQPQLDDDAVFIRQRHHVGHGGQRGNVHIFHGRIQSAQRLHQLERHARAAQRRKRIAVQQRIHHRAVRQRLRRAMVVGDDHVQPQRLRQRHQRHAGHAAVHRDHQRRPRRDGADRRFVQAVALGVTRGQIHLHVRALSAQIVGQQRRRAHAVHVVVAIDADVRALRHGGADAGHGLGHVVEQQRVAQVFGIGMEKALRFLRRRDAALDQQRVQRGIHILRAGKPDAVLRPQAVSEHIGNLSFVYKGIRNRRAGRFLIRLDAYAFLLPSFSLHMAQT